MALADEADKAGLLGGTWLLSPLPAEHLQLLVRHLRSVRYAAGETIFRKGDAGLAMMVVGEGRVRICSTSLDGRSVTLNLIEPGEIFGELALLDGGARSADAVAMERCLLHVLDRRDFLPLLQAHPEIAVRLLTVLSGRLRRTSGLVEDLIFLEQPVRLAKALLWLARRYGRGVPGGLAIELRLSQGELATFVGMRRESLNRQLAAWRADGLLELRSGRITIRDVAAFEALATAAA